MCLWLCTRYFDFEKLREVTHIITENLNKIIDINFYPAETARRSNLRHRPIGIGVQVILMLLRCSAEIAAKLQIGMLSCPFCHLFSDFEQQDHVLCMVNVQGLADTFILLGMPFDSPEAKQLNKEIFETIYFGALEQSCSLAQRDGVLWPVTVCHVEESIQLRRAIMPGSLHRAEMKDTTTYVLSSYHCSTLYLHTDYFSDLTRFCVWQVRTRHTMAAQ